LFLDDPSNRQIPWDASAALNVAQRALALCADDGLRAALEEALKRYGR
jgi:hypothetical protein